VEREGIMADDDTTTTDDDSVDLEPVIRKIVQEENATTNERLSKIEEAVGGLANLPDSIGEQLKKIKPGGGTAKVDEDSIVAKVVEAVKGLGNDGGGNDGGGNNGGNNTGRKPGPLSRFLGVG
jgi:hypothetical protein